MFKEHSRVFFYLTEDFFTLILVKCLIFVKQKEVSVISHLLFSDDLLIFTRATKKEVEVLGACLDKYMRWGSKGE